jgi:Ca2+-binding RTX toxin-like protein
VLVGDKGPNVLSGGPGLDTMQGGEGNDFLLGGEGEDFLSGWFGADSFSGGAGVDMVSYTNSPSRVVVAMGLSEGSGAAEGEGRDGLRGIEIVIGSEFDDLLQGGFGGPVQFDGGGGDDRLFGNRHAEVLNGGAGNDLIFGAGGDDSLDGGEGHDDGNGGPGNDRCLNLEIQTDC